MLYQDKAFLGPSLLQSLLREPRRAPDRAKKLKLNSSLIQISWKLNVLQQVTLQCYGHAIQFYGGKCHSLPSPVHDVEVIVVSKKYQIIIR